MAGHLLFIFFMSIIFRIQGQDLAHPTLTAAPSVITETDRVTLHCQTPPTVYEALCYFYTTNGQNWPNPSCFQTVRGSDLLMVNQRPPVVVQVQCYYFINQGQTVSPPSDKTSVTVQKTAENQPPAPHQWPKPNITLQYDIIDDHVYIVCMLPQAAKSGSKCNLYFGKSAQPYLTPSIPRTRTNEERVLCQFYVPVTNFSINVNSVNKKEVSCDYTLENGHSSLSPRSDGYDLRDVMSKLKANQSQVTTPPLDPVKTTNPGHVTGSDTEAPSTDLNDNGPTASPTVLATLTTHSTADLDNNKGPGTSPLTTPKTHLTSVLTKCTSVLKETPQQPESDSNNNGPATSTTVLTTPTTHSKSGTQIWMWVILTVCGVVVGIFLLVLTFFYKKRTNEIFCNKRSKGNTITDGVNKQDPNSGAMLLVDKDTSYSLITSVPAADCSTGFVNGNRKQKEKDLNETNPYHVYATIPDEPTSLSVKNIIYSSIEITDH